jgi:hypothetical protein
VDDEATLEILTAELFGESAPVFTTMPGYAAPHTREFLAALAEAALEVETLG